MAIEESLVGCVILNYNTWDETINCINSILFYYGKSNFNIYIVDNASTIIKGEEFEKVLYENENVCYIQSEYNQGYAAGNNLGIKQALKDGCDYILLCNSDIIFVDNSITKMINFMEAYRECGIVGPQIYGTDNEFRPFYMLRKLTFSGKIKNMLLKVPIVKMFLKSFKESFILDFELTLPKRVFGVSGCCFLMRKECVEFLFPLDENTFLYEEEYIIGSRLENTGYEVYIIPGTKVIHAEGVSTGGMSPFAYKCLVNSEQYYLKKYLKCNLIQCKFIYFIRTIVFLCKAVKCKEYRKNIYNYFSKI